MRPKLAAAVLAACALPALAQLAPLDPDWKEVESPTPPVLDTRGLIPLDIRSSSLRFGVAPGSVSIGPDAVVRYVVVATSSSGTVNAFYEGIHCKTAEMKTYARHNPDAGWVVVQDAPWVPLHQTANSRHSLVIARTGACSGHSPNRSAQTIVRDLRSPVDTRFANEVR